MEDILCGLRITPFAPLSFAEDLLFYETILEFVGGGVHENPQTLLRAVRGTPILDAPFYNDILKIINFKFVGAFSYPPDINLKIKFFIWWYCFYIGSVL